jgi:ABC-type uncharacterized transport system substrate-binding protein
MSDEIEIEITQSNSMDWTMDEIMSSEIVYNGLTENYGQSAVDAVIKTLEIHKNDISLENNTRIILRILNGDL